MIDGFPDLDHVLTFPLFEEFVKLFVLQQDFNIDPASDQPDHSVWTANENGEYATRSLYLLKFRGRGKFSNSYTHLEAISDAKE